MFKKIRGFKKGGVHPHDKKNLCREVEIERLPLEEKLTISLSQHIGAPATSLVSVGDSVVIGQKIGEATSFVSAAVHSPVDGEVIEIKSIQLPNSILSESIVIKTAETQSTPIFPSVDWNQLSTTEMIEIITEAGVVGAGGATFPTHVKLMVPKGKKAEFLIINGVECEPYLNADNRLMIEKPLELVEGIQIVAKLVDAKKVIIGVENNKPRAIAALQQSIKDQNYPFEVIPLRVRYPQGDEKQLIQGTTGRVVPSGGLPIDIGCVVINIGTIYAIYEAIALNKPFYERVISITGESIQKPSNFLVPIGTPFSSLIEAAGGLKGEVAKWVAGGPMMGFSFYNIEESFVAKGSSGLLALSPSEVKSSEETFCLNCGRCMKSCPMSLQPTRMFRLISNRNYQEALEMDLMDCKECGCCSFICPAKIPLVQGFKLAKKEARRVK